MYLRLKASGIPARWDAPPVAEKPEFRITCVRVYVGGGGGMFADVDMRRSPPTRNAKNSC